jgi:hypothetical protein
LAVGETIERIKKSDKLILKNAGIIVFDDVAEQGCNADRLVFKGCDQEHNAFDFV